MASLHDIEEGHSVQIVTRSGKRIEGAWVVLMGDVVQIRDHDHPGVEYRVDRDVIMAIEVYEDI